MKILFLARSLNTGGAEKQLITLAVALKKKQYDVGVITFYDDHNFLGHELRRNNVPVYSLEKKSRWDVVGFLYRLLLLLKREQPDILHAYLVVPNCITIFLKLFFPSIKMVWGVRASFMDLSQYDWLVKVTYKLEIYLSRFADLIITNSHAGLKCFQTFGAPDEKMIVVSNGIDVERFYPDQSLRKAARESLGLAEDIFIVGIVARVDPMKDYSTFVNAVAMAMEKQPNIRGVCVGAAHNSQYKKTIDAMVREYQIDDKIFWLGKQRDVNYYLNAFDLYVSSSMSGEGFSNSIAEAMAAGVPCVVTDVGDSAMIVAESGIVVEPKESQLLASGILKMYERIQDRREVISTQAREQIASRFTIDKMVERTEQELLQLSQQRG